MEEHITGVRSASELINEYSIQLSTLNVSKLIDVRKQIFDLAIEKKLTYSNIYQIYDISTEILMQDSINNTSRFNDYISYLREKHEHDPSINNLAEYFKPILKDRYFSSQSLEFLPHKNQLPITSIQNNKKNIYSDYLINKNILILGPGAFAKSEIDEFMPYLAKGFTCVLLNSLIPDSILRYNDLINYINEYIVYYNGSNSLKLYKNMKECQSIYLDVINPKWICHKSNILDVSIFNYIRQFPVTKLFPFKFLLEHSSNMLGNVLNDLLGSKLHKVFLVGFDFYVSGNHYRPDYAKTVSNNYDQIKQSLKASFAVGGHDPISNLRYVKCLINNDRRVELSSNLKEIFSLGEREYLNRILSF